MRILCLAGLLSACATAPEPGPNRCPVLLTCPADVVEECDGETTSIVLGEPDVCEGGVVSDDRSEAYAVGAHTVTFAGQWSAPMQTFESRCSVAVEVVDTTSPLAICDEELTLVRSSSSDPYPEPPVGRGSDLCSEVTVSVSPTTLTQPVTDVVTTVTDASGNTESCTTKTTVVDLFPVSGLRVMGADLNGSDTVVQLGWDEGPSAEVEDLQLEFATDLAGPWQVQDTFDVSFFEAEGSSTETGYYRVRSIAGALEGGVSEAVKVHAIAAEEYNLKEVEVPGIPFETSLYGVVRYPVDLDDGPYPLVVLLHGNHGNCRRNRTRTDGCLVRDEHECDYPGYFTAPNAEGMTYQAEALASQGMIAVTISANALNCRGGYIAERSALIRGHVVQWADWNKGSGSLGATFAGAVDLSRLGLVGHSRGGDAVSLAPTTFSDNPVSGVTIGSIFAIAPTDFLDTETYGAPYGLLLPSCDGDVWTLWGSDIYERSQAVPYKSQMFVIDANHNHFSTEWDFNDGNWICSQPLLGKEAQTKILESTLISWMNRTLNGDRPEAWHRAEVDVPASLRDYYGREVDIRWDYSEESALYIENFIDPSVNLLGTNSFSGFTNYTSCFHSECGSNFLARRTALSADWKAGSDAEMLFSLGTSNDSSGYDSLSFRMVGQLRDPNVDGEEQVFSVTVVDSAGVRVTVESTELPAVINGYPSSRVREVLQTVRVPFAALEAKDMMFNSAAIAGIELRFGADGAAGVVAVADLQFGE